MTVEMFHLNEVRMKRSYAIRDLYPKERIHKTELKNTVVVQ